MLFSGSLRMNLDPFDKHTDDELWNTLEVTHLKNFVTGLEKRLQHPVLEGGENMRYSILVGGGDPGSKCYEMKDKFCLKKLPDF